jgi:hypothetical protein
MPLPILPTQSSNGFKTIKDGFKTIKDGFFNKNQFNNITPSFTGSSNLLNNASANLASSSFKTNQNANAEAISRSQGSFNPLIPLIQNVNQTLIRY